VSREQILARLLVAELRFVREDRSELPLELLPNVDDKRRPHIVVKRSVNNLERPVRRKRSAGVPPAVPGACPELVEGASRPRLAGALEVLGVLTDSRHLKAESFLRIKFR
jgi:hypothetical protein